MSKLRESIANLMEEESGNIIRCRDDYLNYIKSLESDYIIVDKSRIERTYEYARDDLSKEYYYIHRDQYDIYSKNPEEIVSVIKILQDLKNIYKKKYSVTPIRKDALGKTIREFFVKEGDITLCAVYAYQAKKIDSNGVSRVGVGISPIWSDESRNARRDNDLL